MTNDRRLRWPRPRVLVPLLVVVLLVAAAVGAYYDWYMWHPMSAIVITMIAGLLVVAGGVAAAINAPRTRPIGLVLTVAGAGAIIGSLVNPTRPLVHPQNGGTLRLVLTAPAPSDASGDAQCASSEDASQVVVDPGEFGLARANEDADFHYLYVTIGDMYDFGDARMRPDHLSLTIRVQAARIPAIEDPNVRPGETVHSSDPSSTLVLSEHSRFGGSLAFANLALGELSGASSRSDLAGTVTWTCGPVSDVSARDPVDLPAEEPVDSSFPE